LIALHALLRSVAVVRFRIRLATALAFGALIAGVLRAQVNEEKRRDQSEEAETRIESTPKPKKSPTPKTKRRHTPTPKPKTAKKKNGPKKTSDRTTKSGKSKSAREEETPKPRKTPAPQEEEARAASGARAISVPTPAPSPQPKPGRAVPAGGQAQVVIEKSSIEEDQGFEPPPSPPPRRGFWPWSRPISYRYLTSSVIDAIRRAPVKRRRWQFIVVHNSGTRQGNARVFDYYHKHVRRMQNGLAYHFVIGNGTSTGNGQIEVGDRWRRQINGGHVHSDYLNNISLGICLVGDFNRDQPTRAQLEACEELIRYLRDRCGKTERGTIPVKPHREMNPPRWATDCPGDDFPYSWFRRF
jgi:N-acetylmuramoyl-L-alanine amidase